MLRSLMLVEANTDSMYSKRRPLPELELLELTINVMTDGHPLSILELRRAGLGFRLTGLRCGGIRGLGVIITLIVP